jgi:hypothetical protein
VKTESRVFIFLVVFFALVTPVYWFLSNDPTGTVALVVTLCLSLLLAFYFSFISTRIPPRPEDRGDAEVYEGAGELGFFSPHSWWPFTVASAAAVVALGLAIGWWLFIIGAVALVIGAIGWVFEYYHGAFAH